MEDHKKNITAIVDQALTTGVKVMILTSTTMKKDQQNKLNQKLAPCNAFLNEGLRRSRHGGFLRGVIVKKTAVGWEIL